MMKKIKPDNLSVRIKLGLSTFLIAMTPMIVVCVIAATYFQSYSKDEVFARVNSDLDWQQRILENYIFTKSNNAREIGFNNDSTRKLAKQMIRYGDPKEFIRKLELNSLFPHFKQYFKMDISRIMIIGNVLKNDKSMIGKLVFSAKKEMVEGKEDVIEDTFQLETKMNSGLILNSPTDGSLAEAYYKSRENPDVAVHDFILFEEEYSFIITAPILKTKNYVYMIPYLEQSDEDREEIRGEVIGLVLIQVTPSSLKEVLGEYGDIGETFLVGKGGKKDLILHTAANMINEASGKRLQPGDTVPSFLNSVAESGNFESVEDRFFVGNRLEITGLDWYQMAVIDSSKVFAPLRQLVLVFIIIGAVGLLLIAVISMFLTNLFAKPLGTLAKVLTTTRETGDFSVRTDISSGDEIGIAIQEVNHLMDVFQTAIQDISVVMDSVAKGDLTQNVSVDLQGDLDKLKNDINTSIQNLAETISGVILTTNKVQNGINEISYSASDLANSATEQAASLEEVSASLNEIGTQTKVNNEKAVHASKITSETMEVGKTGNQQMKDMLSSMGKINETSGNVSKVINTIDEIAFQTNLLALNAAVEAARAGKYGKGFAVVAEEVRNLASRSAQAAKDTTTLIESSIKEVETGMKNSKQTADILTQIISKIETVNDMIDEIANISKEQKDAVDEINAGLTQINNSVQQNSAISQEVATSTRDLTNLALQQKQKVEKFHVHHLDEPDYIEPAVGRIQGPDRSGAPEEDPRGLTRKAISFDEF